MEPKKYKVLFEHVGDLVKGDVVDFARLNTDASGLAYLLRVGAIEVTQDSEFISAHATSDGIQSIHTEYQGKIDAANARITALETYVRQLEGEKTDLATKLTAAEERIVALGKIKEKA